MAEFFDKEVTYVSCPFPFQSIGLQAEHEDFWLSVVWTYRLSVILAQSRKLSEREFWQKARWYLMTLPQHVNSMTEFDL